MNDPRNPFRLRSSENIDLDPTFLRLFGPGVLELIPKDMAWDRLLIFNSAPGGGKTTLFRLFTPPSLLTLYESRANEDLKDLFAALRDLDVVSEKGPQVLGVLLSMARNYDDLEDLNLEGGRRERLLFSLLNSRIIIASLRSALALKKLKFPDDLSSIKIERPSDVDIPPSIPVPCNGKKLYDWASSVEMGVCDAVDSFDTKKFDAIAGHDTLYAPFLLRPGLILHGNKAISQRSLLLLDDVHKLTRSQRESLQNCLSLLRVPIGIWLAQRLVALPSEELLKAEAKPGREYYEITLEEFWRQERNSHKFESTVANIANRRVKLNPEFGSMSFSDFLVESMDDLSWSDKFAKDIEVLSKRVKRKVSSTRLYDRWIEDTSRATGTPRELATQWRMLEVLIERDIDRSQTRLSDQPLELGEVDFQDSGVKQASEFLVAKEFRVPYYFTFRRITKLSSSNIEQFLDIAGDLFEEAISAKLLKQPTKLTPDRQEEILRNAAKRFWMRANSIPRGRDVVGLLEHIAKLCQTESSRPTVPYPPGATGIAITMQERDQLVEPRFQQINPDYSRLAQAISSCAANNYLEVSLDRSQGQQGKRWMILYLNRLLCLHFGLPLQYGGWRPQTLPKLCKALPVLERSQTLGVVA
jgi:hypothetical protein